MTNKKKIPTIYLCSKDKLIKRETFNIGNTMILTYNQAHHTYRK